MREVRIGNDLAVHWAILTNGEPRPLAGRNLALTLWGPTGKRQLTDFSVDGNVLTWVFPGREQHHTGDYILTISENSGGPGMATMDQRGFTLVARMYGSNGLSEPEGIELATAELTVSADTGTYGPATEYADGLMTKEDKQFVNQLNEELPSIRSGAQAGATAVQPAGLAQAAGAFDISAYRATDGVLAKYANLTAALGTNGANVPDALRKGGMSVKFVRSSDNKYVQCRNMNTSFSTTESDWQCVDEEPTANSNNLVKSGGVYQAIRNSALPTLDYENADFGFSDDDGNVIALFANGHFRTKHFDSSKISVNGYVYEGEKIDVKKYQFNYEHIYTETNSSNSSNQGAACFGKYLFQFHNTNDTVDIFNLEEGTKVQTISLTGVSSYHCNCANFGKEYYEQGDQFPLLYVSQEDSSQHKCLVYRISGSEGSWAMSLVQTITFPTPSTNFMWYPNCMVDTQNEKIIIVGLGNYPWSRNSDNIIRYKVYELPNQIDGDVTINAEDAIKSFEIKDYPTSQGGFVRNNKIYQVFGMASNATLSVIDINTGKAVSKVNMSVGGIAIEPESCFLYDNCIWVNFVNGHLYKFNF